jgi:hypothetical protein
VIGPGLIVRQRPAQRLSLTGYQLPDPSEQTLSFIDGMEIFIGDGNSKTRVAFLEKDQNTDVSELRLQVYTDREIGQYLRAEETVVDVEAKGSPPDEDTMIEATMGFSIQLVF